MTIPRFSSTVRSGTLVTALRAKGCAIVEALAEPSVIASINSEFQPFVEANRMADDRRTTQRLTGALRFSPSSRSHLSSHPLVMDVVREVLSPYSHGVRLHMALHRRVLPGATEQVLHRDTHSVPMMALRPGPGEAGHFPGAQFGIAAIWALSDLTRANGATRLVPGSHSWTCEQVAHALAARAAGAEDVQLARVMAVHAEMVRGSVLLYGATTLHAASAADASSDGVRDILLCAYSPDLVDIELFDGV